MNQKRIDLAFNPVPPKETALRSASTAYLWFTVLLVLILNGGLLALERTVIPAQRPLRKSLVDQPLELGHWKGTAVRLAPEITAAVGADEISDRQYESNADVIVVHNAAWNSIEEWMPHEPDACYAAAGWNLVSSSTEALPTRPDVRVAVRTLEKPDRRVTIAFWYQIGVNTFVDRSGARRAHRTLWGDRERPPMIKSLLQTTTDDGSLARLLDLSLALYDRNSRL